MLDHAHAKDVARLSTRPHPNVPISVRAPNPPSPLIGRTAEVERVLEALRVRRVASVAGADGVGKTALALEVARYAGSAMYVVVRSRGALTAALLRALGAADHRLVAREPQLAATMIVDLADALGDVLIVIDDVEHEDVAALRQLLDLADRYARRSRWLAVGRGDLPWTRGGLVLGALGTIDATALSTSAHPERDAAWHARNVAATGGNPRRIVTADATSDRAEELVALLATLSRPLPWTVLAELVGALPDANVLDQLERQGRIVTSPEGPSTRERSGPTRDPLELADRLAAIDDDGARLEATRLYMIGGRADRARLHLDAVGEALCDRGYAPELHALLTDATTGATTEAGELATWRDIATFEWHDAADRGRLAVPEAVDGASALCRWKMLRARGEMDGALAAAERAEALATNDDERCRAIVRQARTAYSMGRLDLVHAAIARCDAATDGALVEREVVRAEALVAAGRGDEAAAGIAALVERVDQLSAAARFRAYLGATRVYLILQRLRAAEALLEPLLAARGRRAMASQSGRVSLQMAAALSALRGNFARARALSDELAQWSSTFPTEALFLKSYLVAADEWQAGLGVARHQLAALGADARASTVAHARDVRCYVGQMETRLAMLAAEPPSPEPAPTDRTGALNASLTRAAELTHALHQARWGRAPSFPEPSLAGWLEHDGLAAMAHACALLIGGEHARAVSLLERAAAAVDRAGFAVVLADVQLALAVAYTIGGDHAALAALCRDLHAHAAALGAPRLADEAEFFAAVAAKDEPALATIEAWAHPGPGLEAHPRARRARVLLGEHAVPDVVDTIDTLLLAALARDGWRRATTRRDPSTAPAGEALGLDFTREVVVADGVVVTDLARHTTLWRLLAALWHAGGAASKEELVRAVWHVDEYHPLNHDNRLRVSVLKLRARMGDHAARLDTTTDGYALRGTWRAWS